MQWFLVRAAVVAIGLWLASKIVPGVHILSPGDLIAAALLLGIVNAFVRPILVILTFPITLLTLGLFLLVINGLMIELVSYFLSGFVVAGFWPAVLTAIVVSLDRAPYRAVGLANTVKRFPSRTYGARKGVTPEASRENAATSSPAGRPNRRVFRTPLRRSSFSEACSNPICPSIPTAFSLP